MASRPRRQIRVGDRAVEHLVLRRRRGLVEALAADDVARRALLDQALRDEDRHRLVRAVDALTVSVQVGDEHGRGENGRGRADGDGPSTC